MHVDQTTNSTKNNILKPRKALNKAFLKVKPNRSQIESFKENLIQLIDRTNDTESEEFHKNLVIDFLKKTYYEPEHFINTKGRNDLVIHNGNTAKSSVGVIVEAKKPTNRSEMLTREKINVKAFQELVLYYLRERITHKNLEIKYLIATNINEWFLFDATLFEKSFAQNKRLVSQFSDFEAGRLAGKTTDFFYKEIAEPFIAQVEQEVEFTHFDIRDYEKPLRNNNPQDDTKLIALFKLLSPEHLLKLPFTNDSNSLDKRFYGELLHIIGLTETKQGGKKLIERQKPGERNTGSLLENAIIQLESMDKIGQLEHPMQFGATHEERLFNVGLTLSITWLNRILFLKLLEAQLLSYHKGDRSYEFLSLDRITDYDDLNRLFFQVLARQHSERNPDVKALFEKVPYLNSSLFEPTQMEHRTLFISNLMDEKLLPIYASTVLKDEKGRKRSGELNALEYLFEFLNAYDFSSEGGEEIQEDNKTLINASVLGLIFEKINGYKDGSFFTPGFITMYMCRETIRKAVVQKFNEAKGWECKDLDGLYDRIEDRQEANDLINSIKICDPAVGSGHFLVSALNEMIAIKNDLNILQDRQGRRLKEYQVEVVNDELIVTDDDGELFEYNPSGKESQRVQEALFHEKQAIIEKCLFGVDINPNSVKICRLRLWIELLKNAYYKNETELETLPNIDINIKCGNSLISRFDLDSDLSTALKDSKWNMDSYRNAVDTYRNAHSKEQKREMEQLIQDIKKDFRSEISANDPKLKRLQKVKGEVFLMENQTSMFELSKREKAARNKKLEKLKKEGKILEEAIQEIKDNKIYENAFEWRFEFPEVLDEQGDYVGFDVVIGNPPYLLVEQKTLEGQYYLKEYFLQQGKTDLYRLFVEKGHILLQRNGIFSFIIPNSILSIPACKPLREYLLSEVNLNEIVNFYGQVFDEANINNIILFTQKRSPRAQVKIIEVYSEPPTEENLNKAISDAKYIEKSNWKTFEEYGFKTSLTNDDYKVLKHIVSQSDQLKNTAKYTLGMQVYHNSMHNKVDISNRIYHSDHLVDPSYYLEIGGRHIRKYGLKNTSSVYVAYGDWCYNKPPLEFCTGEKILVREICSPSGLVASIVTDPAIPNKSLIAVIPEGDPFVFLGILNSRIIGYFIEKTTEKGTQRLFPRVSLTSISELPIPAVDLYNQPQLSLLVKEVVESLHANPDTDISSLEAEIDQLVYQLYGLTEEEIGIVEGAI